jgi:methyl-accepting chemotaxis protein
MPARSPNERLDRLDQIVQIIGEDHLSMKDDMAAARQVVADLAAEIRHGFDQVTNQVKHLTINLDKLTAEVGRIAHQDAERARKLDERLDRVAQEGAERTRALDTRVDNLVRAIGELISRQDNAHPQ